MLITTPGLEALRTDFSLAYQGAYDSTPPWYQLITTTVPSTTKMNTYAFVEKAFKLREWLGPRIAQNLKAQAYQLLNKSYELTVEVDRDDIEDDNLGVYTAMIFPQFGAAIAKHPDELVSDMLISNTALAWDGKTLFNDAHTIGVGTYDNKFDLIFSADNLNTVITSMVGYHDENGRPLRVNPTVLLHAPQLRRSVREVLNATTIVKTGQNVAGVENVSTAAVDNVMRGWLTPIEIPEWADSPTRWVVADCSKPIKPIIYQTRRPFSLVARDNPQDPTVFDRKVYTYGTDGRCNVGITLPFLIALGHS